MRSFVPVVLALLAGIVLGAWQPRGELLAARAENDALRARVVAAEHNHGSLARFKTLLEADPGRPAGPKPAASAAASPAPEATEAPVAEAEGAPDAAPSATVPDPEQAQKSIAAMQDALDVRRAQAMATLIEQADLSDADAARVDAAMDTMNTQLQAELERLAAHVQDGAEPDRRDMMELAANGLDIAIIADDALRDIIPPDVYASLDPDAVDPLNFVSGTTLAGLVAIHDGAAGGPAE